MSEETVERQDEPGADEAGPAGDEVGGPDHPEVDAAASQASAPELGSDTDIQVDPASFESGADPVGDPVASSDPEAMTDTPDELGGTAGGNAGGSG